MPSFFVPGTPAPQGSKRHIGGGRMIESSKKVKPWREKIALRARQFFPRPLTGPITIQVDFLMPRPKAWGKARQDPMTQRPDADKLLRAVCDALTGVAYLDDSQITHITCTKQRAPHGHQPGAHITVTEEVPA